ncbi:MAG: ribosome small subunit-dependent GTPase A [Longimicrobiales bacterium]
MDRGKVFGSEGGVYRLLLESGEEVEASLRGRLKHQARAGDKVVIGDEVDVRRDADGSVTIEEIHPRRTEVVRKGPGGRWPKVLAANVDRLVIVGAVARPRARQAIFDRLLVIGEANGLEPVLVLNKVDLLEGERAPGVSAFSNLYSGLGYQVLETSAKDGQGLDCLKEVLCQGTSVLVGPSGVGKSSLLNAIEPGLGLRIGRLSERQGRGRHTTVSGRLIPLRCGGLVADTPGFTDVGVWGVEPRELEGCFPEFSPHRDACQFRGCTHLHEPGCRVRDALQDGEIDAGRFDIYRVLREEARGA